MNAVRFAPLIALAAGVFVLLAAACGGDKQEQAQAVEPPVSPTATATATATPTSVPPTPTPTATPFAGKIGRLALPRFGVNAPIEELGLTPDNYLDTPKDENRAVGWYYIYDRPGWRGNAVFSAHVYYGGIPGPFVNLAKSVEGDKINVTMEDGTTYEYTVFSNTRYNRDTMPMGDIIWPSQRPANEEWVTLITCGGQLDATGQQYLQRDVVVAKRTLD